MTKKIHLSHAPVILIFLFLNFFPSSQGAWAQSVNIVENEEAPPEISPLDDEDAVKKKTIKENIGKPVPDFTLPLLSGDRASLQEIQDGKDMVLMFWATWCPYCHQDMGLLVLLKEEMGEDDLNIVLVNVGEEAPAVKEYARKNNVSFPIFLDSEQSLVDAYGIYGVPTFYFVNAKGIVENITFGLP